MEIKSQNEVISKDNNGLPVLAQLPVICAGEQH